MVIKRREESLEEGLVIKVKGLLVLDYMSEMISGSKKKSQNIT